ncbi:plastid-lipid-associated protein, chloroplastic-like [Andrographis paniculata]|uniref:plastid-lipid-associated protein, chloroplastic-like n=1 Tax=Andrographis paniculata TaxID=175694 RepID=UPI0021E7804C|nr:plastid-lipid-associated protein, chloroplastic-like [Andrographis paniculata]
MSSIPSIHPFLPCQILQQPHRNPGLIASNACRIGFSALSARKSMKLNREFTVQAAEEGAWDGGVVRRVTVHEVDPEDNNSTEIESLKKQLIDSFYGTNRGLCASSETRAEIVELISHLEAKNPTPAPTEALSLLNGKWILAYTSLAGFFPLFSREEALPLVKVEEISQTIDSQNFTVQNSVVFVGPLASTEISTNAKFEVRSPKRVQIKFEEGVIGTPQLTDSIELPENVEFLGQHIDLAPVKGLLSSVGGTASSVAKTISSQSPFKFSMSNLNNESWLLTTYLDDDLRISRDDRGSIYVLIKKASPLLIP